MVQEFLHGAFNVPVLHDLDERIFNQKIDDGIHAVAPAALPRDFS